MNIQKKSLAHATKQTYHHGDLRRALIDAAIDLIAQQGIEGLTLREVAQRVGVSHMAPYRHFENKAALLAALAQEGFQELHTHLTAALQQASEPIEQLQAIGVAYVLFAVDHASHYRVMFDAAPSDRDSATRSHAAASDRTNFPNLYEAAIATFNVLVQVLAEGQQANLIGAGDPRSIAQVQWSLVHGLAMLIINGQIAAADRDAARELAEFATGTAIDGLRLGN